MITVSEVKEILARYVDSEREIDNQLERLSLLEDKMYSLGSPELSDMPRNPSPSHDRIAGMIGRKQQLEERVERLMKSQKTLLNCLEGVVDDIGSSDKRAVVRMRYFDGEKWDSVAELMFGMKDDFDDRHDSYVRRVLVLHGQALQEMAVVIGASEELQNKLKRGRANDKNGTC